MNVSGGRRKKANDKFYIVIAGSGSYSDRCESPLGVFRTIDDAEARVMRPVDDKVWWEDFDVYEVEIGGEPIRVRSYERTRRGRPVLIPWKWPE